MPNDGRRIVVVASGEREFREYLLRGVAAVCPVHLVDVQEPTWQRPYLASWTVVADTDATSVVTAVRRLAAEHQVLGVLTWHEEHVVQAALAAAELGLPGPSVVAAERCRDKLLTRTALAAAGCPQPIFAVARDVEEALAAADAIGWPVVIKPRASGGSIGVVLAADADELAVRFAGTQDVPVRFAPEADGGVLVEEYLDGPEITVDSIVQGGTVTPVFLGRKRLAHAPYFEEMQHVVSHHEPLLRDPSFTRLLADVHTALGFVDGWTHAELRLTAAGPRVIEVNGRLGGDLIPLLGMRASGIDPAQLVARVACGEPVSLAPTVEGYAAVRFLYPPQGRGLVRHLSFDRVGVPPEVDDLVPLAAEGSVVAPPENAVVLGRVALVTAHGATVEGCRAALDAGAAALRLAVDDVPEAWVDADAPGHGHGHGHGQG
jgi:D-alanine-D-alanine ligase-like ATP-grasp enzyme